MGFTSGSFSVAFEGLRDNWHRWVDLATTKAYGVHIIRNSFFELCCNLEDQSSYDSDYSFSMDSGTLL